MASEAAAARGKLEVRRSSLRSALGSRRERQAPAEPKPAPRANPATDTSAQPPAGGVPHGPREASRHDPSEAATPRTPGPLDPERPRPRPKRTAVVSAGLTERLAEREAVARRSRLRRALAVLGVLVVLGALVWAIFFSPLFALDPEKVEVESSSPYVDAAQVTEIVAAQAPTPLPRINTGGVETELATVPGVLSAEVTRALPQGLRVVVTPRTPVAFASGAEGEVLVDADGVAVARTQDLEGDRPVLPTLDVPLAPPEDAAGNERVRAALSVLGVLPEGLLGEVATAAASSSDAVTLTMNDGATVRWGSTDDAELKASVLAVLVDEAPGREYDVSVPDRPTVR